VFGAPQNVVRVAMAIRVVAHNTVNGLCSFYLDRKLRRLLIAPRLAHLVRLLQGSILEDCKLSSSTIKEVRYMKGPPPKYRQSPICVAPL
jgi:hypothetical protein